MRSGCLTGPLAMRSAAGRDRENLFGHWQICPRSMRPLIAMRSPFTATRSAASITAQGRVRNCTWPGCVPVVPLSSVESAAVIAAVKMRFWGKVLVDTRIKPACERPAAR
jgi:hypothetical protein